MKVVLVAMGSLIGLLATIGALATRSQWVARTWNRLSPFAARGFRYGQRTYKLQAPHELGSPGHAGRWHWQAYWGPFPLWHRRKFRFWKSF